MSTLLSVLTPDWLIHASDLPSGAPRTLVLRRGHWRGLVTLVGSDEIDWLAEQLDGRPSADPEQLSKGLCVPAGARLGDARASIIFSGWGVSQEGRDVSFKYVTSSFEHGDDAPGFTQSGAAMVPSPARPGEGGRARAKASYSVHLTSTGPLAPAVQREVEALPKRIRNEGAQAVAMACVEIVRRIEGGPVTLAHITGKGAVEAAVFDGAELRPLAAGDGGRLTG